MKFFEKKLPIFKMNEKKLPQFGWTDTFINLPYKDYYEHGLWYNKK